MATTTSPTSAGPLSQALARKKRNPLPIIFLAVGLIGSLAFAVLGYLESQRTEKVVVFVRDVPYGQQITAEDIGTIEVAYHRPVQLKGIGNPNAVIGQFAARNLGSNDLAQPPMLMPEPPTQPVYPNGEQLTPNMVPVPFSTVTIGPLTFRDRVNIGFNDPSGDPLMCDNARSAAAGDAPTMILPSNSPAQPRPYACRLLSYVRVLYVDDAEGVAYLELSPYQSHTIWALQAAGLQLWGERYGVTSDTLDFLNRLDAGQVTQPELTAPIPTPQPREDVAAPVVPGASSAIPGSVQP